VEEAKTETDQKFRSPVMIEVSKKALKAARFDSTVLLTGESGSGKDFLARYVIHEHSKRAHGPYFSINCAAIPSEMAESELFGHERGAFTGALTRKRGLLELAEGGTLLLNEIGEMALAIQAKLFTFLDTGTFNRVGGEKSITPNVRIIVATHRKLEEEISQGRFLEPLYHRLQVLELELPPLRKRLEDLPIIVDELLTQLCEKLNLRRKPKVTSSHISALASYHWPGNVRELRNVLETALILSEGTGLALGEALLKKPHSASDRPTEYDWFLSGGFRKDESEGSLLENAERRLIEQALAKSNGVRARAARLLGISWASLKPRLRRLGISGPK
jgi:DNA-binding NtrC family response regulator